MFADQGFVEPGPVHVHDIEIVRALLRYRPSGH